MIDNKSKTQLTGFNSGFIRYSLAAAKKQAACYSAGVYKEWYYTDYGYAIRNRHYPNLWRDPNGPDYFRIDKYENCENSTARDPFANEPSDTQ